MIDHRADVPLNTWAVVLAAAHAPAYEGALSLLTAELAASWSSLAASSLPSWRSAAARQLVADAVRSRAEGYPYDDWTTISWVRSVNAPSSTLDVHRPTRMPVFTPSPYLTAPSSHNPQSRVVQGAHPRSYPSGKVLCFSGVGHPF